MAGFGVPLHPVLRYSSTDEQHLDFGTFSTPPTYSHMQIPVLAENELYVSHVWAWAAHGSKSNNFFDAEKIKFDGSRVP